MTMNAVRVWAASGILLGCANVGLAVDLADEPNALEQRPDFVKTLPNDYSEEALKTHGNNLRTYLTLRVYADVLRKVIGVPQPSASPPVAPTTATVPTAWNGSSYVRKSRGRS